DYGQWHWEVVKSVLIGIGDNAAVPICVMSVLFLIGFVVFLFLAITNRAPWQLTMFAVATLALAVGSRAHISMIGRHLLPAFPVLFVPAAMLTRASLRN